MFNIHEIDDDYDVFVAFETMNNRGKKLTNLELLKNRLIYFNATFRSSEYYRTARSLYLKEMDIVAEEVIRMDLILKLRLRRNQIGQQNASITEARSFLSLWKTDGSSVSGLYWMMIEKVLF